MIKVSERTTRKPKERPRDTKGETKSDWLLPQIRMPTLEDFLSRFPPNSFFISRCFHCLFCLFCPLLPPSFYPSIVFLPIRFPLFFLSVSHYFSLFFFRSLPKRCSVFGFHSLSLRSPLLLSLAFFIQSVFTIFFLFPFAFSITFSLCFSSPLLPRFSYFSCF